MSSKHKKRLEVAVADFLELNLKPSKVAQCKIKSSKWNKEKEVIAIPENLVDDFADWLDIQIDNGLFDRNYDDSKRKSAPPKLLASLQKLNQKSLDSKTESSKTRESHSKDLKDSKETFQGKNNQESKEGWTAWPILIRNVFPSLPVDRAQFSLFAKAFLESNKIEPVKLSVPGMPLKCSAIPNSFELLFIEKFTEKFKYIDEIKAVVSPGRKRLKRMIEESNEASPSKIKRVEDLGLTLYNKYLFPSIYSYEI